MDKSDLNQDNQSSFFYNLFEKHKRNIWIINSIPIVLIQIISIPFYVFESLDNFLVFTFSLLILPILLTIINYRIGLLRLKLKFWQILLITVLAVVTSFLFFFIPELINLIVDNFEMNKIGLAYYVFLMLFSLVYTFFLGLISFGFYTDYLRKSKLDSSELIISIYVGTLYMVEYFKEVLHEKKIDSKYKHISKGEYELFVEKHNSDLANKIIYKTTGNT